MTKMIADHLMFMTVMVDGGMGSTAATRDLCQTNEAKPPTRAASGSQKQYRLSAVRYSNV